MKPVTSPLSKKGSKKETTELRQAFNDTKEAIRQKIKLAAFNPTRPVYLITDASDVAWGALVTHNLSEVPLAWLLKTLSPAEQKCPANKRELIMVVSVFRRKPRNPDAGSATEAPRKPSTCTRQREPPKPLEVLPGNGIPCIPLTNP